MTEIYQPLTASEAKRKYQLGIEYENRMESFIEKRVDDTSDANIQILIEQGEGWDDPIVNIKMLLEHGMFDVSHIKISHDKMIIGISARQRMSGEINMLIKSFRWIANTLEDQYPCYDPHDPQWMDY